MKEDRIEKRVAVYGPAVGYGSHEVVTRGLIEACEDRGVFAGHFASGRSRDDHAPFAGASAHAAVFSGPYSAMGLLSGGLHQYRAAMVAINSSWVPPAVYANAEEHLTELLTPSDWSKEMLLESAPKGFRCPVRVLPHGCLRGFCPPGPGETSPIALSESEANRFAIVHLAASSEERKGTYELARAFSRWKRRKDALLILVVSPLRRRTVEQRLLAEHGKDVCSCISVSSSLNAAPALLRWVYHAASVVCQPSRAEGFGLVGLEALCTGTPVVATAGTGHLQWCTVGKSYLPGFVPIGVGPLRAVGYDPGGMAPTVGVEETICALDVAFDGLEGLRAAAIANSHALRQHWSWASASAEFLTHICEKEPQHDRS